MDNWTTASKRATATIKNQCPFGMSFLCKNAGTFVVNFDGEELPTSMNYRPQVSQTVPSLARGASMTLSADFTPFARIENNYFWNVTQIRVTADPKNEVSETNEGDNTRLAAAPFNSELPIVLIDAGAGMIASDPKIPATMKIVYDPAGGRNFVTGPVLDYNGNIGIELRGQLSSTFCKKQYGLETWNSTGDETQVSLLGFPAESDWILYGPYDDKSLIRNIFASSVSNAIGRYASRTMFVELFVKSAGAAGTGCPALPTDGYAGIYVLMEKVKRDVGRVNVAKLTAADNTEPAVTGGYVLKKDWADPGDATFTTNGTSGYATPLTYVYPKCKLPSPCDATAQQKAWIEDYMNDFEAALKSANFADPVSGYAKYIDVPSFVDYYLLEELVKNSDGFRASTYMHKERGGKLKMGPIWDMNFSMGNVGFPVARPPEGWLLGAMGDQMKWWKRLMEDPVFAQNVIDRWQSLRETAFKTSTLQLTLDNAAYKVRFAQARNFNRWPILGVYVVGNPTPVDPNETYKDAVQQMKTWLDARTSWIDANIPSILPP